MALSPTSPAIDVIPVSSGDCPTIDQRGVSRLGKGESFCDIGAYEYVVRAPVTIAYTGPTSIKRGKNVSLSAKLTNTTGDPISGRVLRMQIGKGRYIQSCATPRTNARGKGSCVIEHVMAFKSPNLARVWFDGDPAGPNYDYAPGYKSTPVKIVI